MPLPYQFVSGEIARSAQVNANFEYIMDMLGQLSTPDRIQPLGEFIMGPRKTALLSGAHDTGPTNYRFYQISWNADWNKVGTEYAYVRILPNLNAAAFRLGERGFDVFMTSKTTGDLNSQMLSVFRVTDKIVFLPDATHIVNKSAYANIQDYRSTTVLLNNPTPLFSLNHGMSRGTTVRDVYGYNVPSHAHAVILSVEIKAVNGASAGITFYKNQTGGVEELNRMRGFSLYAPVTGTGLGQWAGGQGIVQVGMGAQAGEIVIHRTGALAIANICIIGYLT
jgi:hypothetical protein